MADREHDRWSELEQENWYVRARLRLVSTKEGGRQGPIKSGYRSHWAFPTAIHNAGHDAPLTIESGPDRWLQPGEETTVRLHPLMPDLWPPIEPGLQLTMLEGSRVVGRAEVLEVIRPV